MLSARYWPSLCEPCEVCCLSSSHGLEVTWQKRKEKKLSTSGAGWRFLWRGHAPSLHTVFWFWAIMSSEPRAAILLQKRQAPTPPPFPAPPLYPKLFPINCHLHNPNADICSPLPPSPTLILSSVNNSVNGLHPKRDNIRRRLNLFTRRAQRQPARKSKMGFDKGKRKICIIATSVTTLLQAKSIIIELSL